MPNNISYSTNPYGGSNAAIGTDFEDVGNPIPLKYRFTHFGFELENTHTSVSLADFQLLGQIHEDADYQVFITGTGWDNLSNILKARVGALNTLAATLKGVALLDVTGFWSIKFQAKTGSSGSATIRGTCTRNI